MALIRIPVQTDMRYTISCEMKTQDVVFDRGQRKATLFAEWEDTTGKHVPGGYYPHGLEGTNDWQAFRIDFTNAVPDGVGYIKLYVALEGKGKMWVRDLKVTHFDDWHPLAIQAPESRERLGITQPLLSWEPAEDRPWRVVIASDKALTRNRQSYLVGDVNEFRVPEGLPRGSTWHWQVQDASSPRRVKDRLFGSPVSSFVIARDAVRWPVTVERGPAWFDDSLFGQPRPELTLDVESDGNVRVDVTIDGHAAEVVSFTGDRLVFKPSRDLEPANHQIVLTFRSPAGDQHATTFYFNNEKPGAKVTFEGGIVSVDGRPFFPIGTYRDPSDDFMNFSGIKEAGFNLTHSYEFQDSLGRANNTDTVDTVIQKADAYLGLMGLGLFLTLHRRRPRA